MSKTLDELKEYIKITNLYNHVTTLLYWDMETIMPKEGFEGHSDALTFFSTEGFKRSTAPELEAMLDKLLEKDEFDKLDDNWKFIVKRMKRDFDESKNIPPKFYEECVRNNAESGQAWQEAKKASDFSIFAPYLKKQIEQTKKMQEYIHPGKEVYDALLGTYEEGMDSATYDRLFGELKEGLLPLLDKILAAKQPDSAKFKKHYDIDAQKKVEKLLLNYIGFNFDRGTTGETEHPFTDNFSSKDVRVSNHFHEDEAIDPMFSAIHEGGHAIFEQNVDDALDGTAGGSCGYLGVHESQSRFYENILGRNKNFWIPIFDDVTKLLPELGENSLDDFYKEINHVKNSYIRTMADEVTYCLHIILRYEIEKEIFRNNYPVDELPKLWNKKMEEYLHIVPRNDAEGILQDMHWSDGSFGYFPTYLLGSIYDGMYLDAIREELGDIDTILKEGRIKEITKWLNEKIHKYGSTRLPREVIANVCGKEVSAEPLLRYFTEKYTEVYGL